MTRLNSNPFRPTYSHVTTWGHTMISPYHAYPIIGGTTFYRPVGQSTHVETNYPTLSPPQTTACGTSTYCDGLGCGTNSYCYGNTCYPNNCYY